MAYRQEEYPTENRRRRAQTARPQPGRESAWHDAAQPWESARGSYRAAPNAPRGGASSPRGGASSARAGASYRAGAPRKTPARQQPPRRGGRGPRRTLVMIALLLLFAAVATAGIVGFSVYQEIMDVRERGTFYRGVYVNGYELYGATPQEAYDFILERARQELSGFSIALTYGSDYRWEITPDTLDVSSSLENVVAQAVNEAYAVGRMGSTIEAYDQIRTLKTEPKLIYTSDVTKSDARIDALLAEIKATVDVPAQDATWVFNPERQNPIVITPETYGKSLDTEALKAQVMQMVNGMQPGSIEIAPAAVRPSVVAEDISSNLVRIGNFSTVINKRSTDERNLNIERGCNAFNGKVIKAGAKVSFNSWVGKRTQENGFYQALEIVYGEYEMGWGGGICQVSSTLYNAVIQAGLKINTRTNHSLPANYIDMGLDATVSDRGIDFVFTNDTGADIYVVARLEQSGNTKSCLFQLYGRPEPNGYTYSLMPETVEVLPIPSASPVPDKKAEYVVYNDQTKQVAEGTEGYKVRTYLVTKDASGNVIDTRELYTDTYKPTAPKVYVGVTKRTD